MVLLQKRQVYQRFTGCARGQYTAMFRMEVQKAHQRVRIALAHTSYSNRSVPLQGHLDRGT